MCVRIFMTDEIVFSHVNTHVIFENPKEVDDSARSLVKVLRNGFATNPVPRATLEQFIDVPPNAPHSTRVRDGIYNENVLKQILSNYIDVKNVSKKQDMYDKTDCIASGTFGSLHCQLKNRNTNKNSDKNDLGVEYVRIYDRNGAFEIKLGRDRSSIADVYICVDAVNYVIHCIPTSLIEQCAREIHEKFNIKVSKEKLNPTSHTQGTFLSIYDRASNRRIKKSIRGGYLADKNIGEIRYFKPKTYRNRNENEGVFKAVFYMSMESDVAKQYEVKIPTV